MTRKSVPFTTPYSVKHDTKYVWVGSKSEVGSPERHVRSTLNSRRHRIAPARPVRAKSKLMHRNKKGDLFDHLSAHACAGSFGQPRLPKALNQ